ncbi:hypothetical protein ACQR1W_01920 [Bradyrhizobium sp. HKCCYLS1011]|uniref:hypothetical protein n=1 Tax=Bradyrhizobium sp. HKCCYLS1011 TaxID=3420733 RepID=UPI003EB9B71D
MTEESKNAAEDYRRQRQSADAYRNGFRYTTETFDKWLARNEQLLRDIIKANGTSDADVEQVLEGYKSYIAAAPPGSQFDDKNARAILGQILQDIERLCREQKIPIRNGVVYGVAPELGLLAGQREVIETDVSIIDVSMPFLAFCNCVSKLIARTLPHEREPSIDERKSLTKVSNDPAAVVARLRASPELIGEWILIVLHFACGWLPPSLIKPPPDQAGQVTRIFLLKSMEWFALAHEYGHHVMKHGQATSSSEETYNVLRDEHEADIFARAASIALGDRAEPPNLYAMFGVGGVIVLGMMDMVRRARWVLETGADNVSADKSHPPLADRINVFGLLDQMLPEELRPMATDMRNCFLKIIEGIWESVLPAIQQGHRDGVRPAEAANQPGWLPS